MSIYTNGIPGRYVFQFYLFYYSHGLNSYRIICQIHSLVPRQDNKWDCGVFVCRYAYNLFIMRNLRFTREGYNENFVSLITRGKAFQFDMSDIARIRKEMSKLFDNLSKVYLRRLKEQESATKKAKCVAKLKDSSEVVIGDAKEVSTDKDDKGNDHAKKSRRLFHSSPHPPHCHQ